MRARNSRSWALGRAAPFLVGAFATASASAQTAPPEPDQPATVTTTIADVVVSAAPAEATVVANTPGGAGLITAESYEQGRVSTISDVFAFEPGVYAQSTSGSDATVKFSIRGSGLQRSPNNFGAGVLIQLDGLPLLTSTGLPVELIEPLAARSVEVFRGGNAFDLGALTLGGAINYISYTGYNASPAQARFEAGSFGYLREQVSSGLVAGPFDYYISATGFQQDGFRVQSQASSEKVVANFGYKINPDLETRFYFRYAHDVFQVPSTITQAQLQRNPQQANAAAVAFNWYKVIPGSAFIGNKTTLTIDQNSKVEFGAAFKSFPNHGPGGPYVQWEASDISTSVKYSRSDAILGHQSNLAISLLNSTALNPSFQLFSHSAAVNKGVLLQNVKLGGGDTVLLATDDLETIKDLWLTTGLALSYVDRQSNIIYPVQNNFGRTYLNYAPRVGLRYNINPEAQVYANVTRTVEPATNWSYPLLLLPASSLRSLDLEEQTATTAEVGTRGKAGIFRWSASYYYSWVNNELLTVALPGSTLTATSNASPTRHQGVELGLDTVLWQSAAGRQTFFGADLGGDNLVQRTLEDPQHQLILRQVYTWNDFHFAGDPTFGANRLPGLPEHLYRAELQYRNAEGFYAGVNVESVFNAYPIDYANSFYAKPYAIVGAKIGFAQPKQGWEAYVEARNLANVKYTSAVTPIFNARGRDAAVFYPGDGVGVYGGASYRF
ncbi:TonB-dependent receptor family protein [Methylocapsa aurea]|uniref:TonB-dependent receptor family protein n=1 Tax=Methylocapsa aurea TaxID=663610 RepID=UPI00055F3FC1|nr:TonB-dependent receptor [Methylocapsa aurea]